jgi:CubicO group peptidase (beta-lactamase class C family)
MYARGLLSSLTLGIVFVLSLGITHAAEVLPLVERPEDVGLSSERLGRLSTVTHTHVETGQLGGAVLLVARHGRIAYFECFGYRDRAAGTPMTKEAIFRIASMTKPITSIAVMMLHEEGKLQIYDPVSRYLPELAKLKVGVEKTDPQSGQKTFDTVEAQRDMTIQDLPAAYFGIDLWNAG